MNSIFKRLAKWVVKHGIDELNKEIESKSREQAMRQGSGVLVSPPNPPDPMSGPTHPPSEPPGRF